VKTAHVYLNDREQHELDKLCDELGSSSSGVLRLGLRLMAGLPVPSRIMEQHREQLETGGHNAETLSATG
jgi:hypothetical protein